MSIESPKYKIIERDNKFEIRDYERYIVAEVDVEASYNSALNSGFGILAGYIFGGNSARTSIAMTAPVTENSTSRSEKIEMTRPVSTYRKQGQTHTISFSMPRKYTLDTLPLPNDQNIRLREVPASKMAALRFSGSLNERLVTKKTSELMEWLKRKNLSPKSDVASCQYNPPWIPGPFRTNEVIVTI
jgi:effector-binding domain-containing protein